MKYRKLTLVLGLVILAGCATAAQRQAQQIRAGTHAAALEYKACVYAIQHKPEYAMLAMHLPDIQATQPTMRQLTDETVPTVDEVGLIASQHDEIVVCRKSAYDEMQAVQSATAGTLMDSWNKRDATLAQLVQRKITWAEALRRGQQTTSETISALHAVDREVMGELRAEHESELARRREVGNALLQWSTQQQMINAINRPTMTTCSGTGSMVNCVSH